MDLCTGHPLIKFRLIFLICIFQTFLVPVRGQSRSTVIWSY
jgi:hypothetical protein